MSCAFFMALHSTKRRFGFRFSRLSRSVGEAVTCRLLFDRRLRRYSISAFRSCSPASARNRGNASHRAKVILAKSELGGSVNASVEAEDAESADANGDASMEREDSAESSFLASAKNTESSSSNTQLPVSSSNTAFSSKESPFTRGVSTACAGDRKRERRMVALPHLMSATCRRGRSEA